MFTQSPASRLPDQYEKVPAFCFSEQKQSAPFLLFKNRTLNSLQNYILL